MIKEVLISLLPSGKPTDLGINVLIVEDNVDVSEIWRRTITQALGADVEAVHTAYDGLEKMDWADILILDWRLRKDNGKSEAQLVFDRWVREKGAMPIAIISGYMTDEIKQHLIRNGAHIVIEKPIDLEAFLIIIIRFANQVKQHKELDSLRQEIASLKLRTLTLMVIVLISMLTSNFEQLAAIWELLL